MTPGPTPGVGRAYLSALLGLGMDRTLTQQPLPTTDPAAVGPHSGLCHPWDSWWIAMRSLGRLRPPAGFAGACADCIPRAAAAAAAEPPVHPGHHLLQCRCHRVWAEAMRARLPDGALSRPPQCITVALLKPGAPRALIRARLRTAGFLEVHVVQRQLTGEDCDRLYPDAYGASFVADRTRYLTSDTVQIIVLVGGGDAVARGAALKSTIRAELTGDGEDLVNLVNHLHMPDNPAEALADVALLAGWEVLVRIYRRWESNGEGRISSRLAGYGAHLDRHRRSAGMGQRGICGASARPAAPRR